MITFSQLAYIPSSLSYGKTTKFPKKICNFEKNRNVFASNFTYKQAKSLARAAFGGPLPRERPRKSTFFFLFVRKQSILIQMLLQICLYLENWHIYGLFCYPTPVHKKAHFLKFAYFRQKFGNFGSPKMPHISCKANFCSRCWHIPILSDIVVIVFLTNQEAGIWSPILTKGSTSPILRPGPQRVNSWKKVGQVIPVFMRSSYQNTFQRV